MPKSRVPAVSQPSVVVKKQKKAKKPKEQMTPYLALMADLMNATTVGAARPDMKSVVSIVWREPFAYNITPDANGDFGVVFSPQISNHRYSAVCAVTPGLVSSTPLTAMVNQTELIANFSEYRPYGLVVSVKYIGESQLSKGIIGSLVNTGGITVGDTYDAFVDEPGYSEVSCDEGVTRVDRYYNNEIFAATNAGQPLDPTSFVAFIGRGLPVTAGCIRVTGCFVFEGLMAHNKLLSRNAARVPCHMAQCHAAANIVGGRSEVSSGPDGYSKIVTHATKLAKMGAELNMVFQTAKTWGTPLMEALSLL